MFFKKANKKVDLLLGENYNHSVKVGDKSEVLP
jgi:hypothetical protein